MDQEWAAYWQNLDTATCPTADRPEAASPRLPGLTILGHPDTGRIGERIALLALASGKDVSLSRLEPVFSAPGETSGQRRPLADPHLSRSPIRLTAAPGGAVRVIASATRTRVVAGDAEITESRDFPAAEIERGVVLLLADRIVLLLHSLDPLPPEDLPRFGLVGDSAAIVAVRREIARVADLDVPVLLRGETGTGKELVAQAIHQASARRSCPFVAVNMGAVPPTLAAAELFGAVRGAFTGADRRRSGYFTRAQGGTLLLDEIGETPPEVQTLLLRTLETGVIQAVGSETPQEVDVRILAATDADLGAEIAAGRFRAPLLHRLSGYEIRLPPLGERRDDVGRLLVHFLRQELEALGETWRPQDRGAADPWLPASVVAQLVAYSWPGNVRQLRNVARQLVIGNRGADRLQITPKIEELLGESVPAGTQAATTPTTAPVSTPAPLAAGDHLADEPGRAVLKTLLLIELVAGTRLVESLGEQRAPEVLSRHDRAVRSLLGEYGGHEIDKSEGFLLLFDHPIDAVGYALEYHETLAELSRELGVELVARAGIHLGDVLLHRDHTFDPPSIPPYDKGGRPLPSPPSEEVARGAKALEVEALARLPAERLTALAAGGQTLLTRAAYELARQSARGDHPLAGPEVRWLDHGEYRLEGLAEPVGIFEVGVAGTAPLAAPAVSERSEPGASAPPAYRSPGEVDEDELVRVLKAHRFRLQPTAAALRISRTSLYALIEKSSRIRKARDLEREEIERCQKRFAGDLDAMAAELEVSRKGLRRRMTQLGIA